MGDVIGVIERFSIEHLANDNETLFVSYVDGHVDKEQFLNQSNEEMGLDEEGHDLKDVKHGYMVCSDGMVFFFDNKETEGALVTYIKYG
jgi:hypothetical protein